MSKIIYLCKRSGRVGKETRDHLRVISDALAPDNIKSQPIHQLETNGSIAYSVIMCRKPPVTDNGSLLLGMLFDDTKLSYLQPETPIPDGNYALFRNNDHLLEIIADNAGTRTVWYFMNNDQFIASTSQRALIMYLGDFFFNDKVVKWMLSTGSLGPTQSWDPRIKRLQAGDVLKLKKNEWQLTKEKSQISFAVIPQTKKESKKRLVSSIDKTFATIRDIDYRRWVLPLSGGYDSRAILVFLKKISELPDYFKTITWGLESSIHEEGNDAKVAKELADKLSVKHEYYHTDLSNEPLQFIVDRFLKCGEGRIDHLAAYMDGLEIWRRLYDEKLEGVIRGDEGFGWLPVSSELTVRLNTGCALCRDFKNLQNLDQYQDFPDQHLPKGYLKKNYESIEQWRDRLYHIYRLPTILSALSDIKFSYVDLINPLLSTEILKTVRELPDNLRTDKLLFIEVIDEIGPDIPIAQKSANASPENLLRSKEFVELLKDKIYSKSASTLFTQEFLSFIGEGIKMQMASDKKSGGKKSLIDRLKTIIPRRIRFWLKDMGVKPTVDGNKLAFRIYMIVRMNEILNEDKETLTGR